MKVQCSAGEVDVLPGDRWQDPLTGSRWQVVEPDPNGARIHSPSGWGGTPIVWCRLLEEDDASASASNARGCTDEQKAKVLGWLRGARADGCVAFCADSVAAGVHRARALGCRAHAPAVQTAGEGARHG